MKKVQLLKNTSGIKNTACLISLLIVINCSYCQQKNTAQKGILDLQNHSWTKNGITDLNGEWEFYWKSLYTPASFDSAEIIPSAYAKVPGFWNSLIPGVGLFKPAFGYATYRLKVLCPPSNKNLELKFLTIASAYKLFINGKQLLEVGKIGTTKATTTPAYKPVIVPVMPEKNELNIVIQVANFNYSTGGIWDFIKLGTHEQIHDYWVKNIARDFFIAGSFFLIGIFYFVIYFFFRRGKGSLYFALFCILLAMRPLITDELAINYVTNWNWQFIKHIEFVSFYLAVPVLSLFSYELFSREFSKKILRYILIISTPFVVVALFTSPLIFRYTLRPFQVFMLLTACYGLYVYVNAAKNKRIGSSYFLAGFIILFITIINDLLYTSLLIQSANLLYAGLFIFIICQATALSRQFFQTFIKLEALNKQLEQINNELSQKNNTINETNDQLTKLNAELDSLVFRTSHDLRSPITSIFTLADIIKEENDPSKRNRYLELQKKTLLRLNAIITDILDFAKNKSTELHYEKVDLDEFINNALQDHIFSDNSEKIKRIVEIHQQYNFETDKARLSMVINNLISNGLKYHNKEQDNPYLKIVVKATQKEAEIEISDNGQGIAEKHMGHIFTMFYRANKTLPGSGLGLYIVKEAIEKLGGTIKIESQINVGTKFLIVIPNFSGN